MVMSDVYVPEDSLGNVGKKMGFSGGMKAHREYPGKSQNHAQNTKYGSFVL